MLILNGESGAKSLAFTADGTRLVAARNDWVDVWAVPGGERVLSFELEEHGTETSVALHPSGKFIFVGSDTDYDSRPLTVLSLGGKGRTLSTHDQVSRVIASPDGQWGVARGEELNLYGFRCSPAGKLCAEWTMQMGDNRDYLGPFVGDGTRFVTVGYGIAGGLHVRETETGEVIDTVDYPSSYGYHAATSPDGSQLAVQGYSLLYVWDTAKWGKPKRIESVGGRRFTSFAFHPTRPLFAAIQSGQTLVKFFDTANWKLSARFAWKLGDMAAVTFSPDGTLAAASSKSGKIVVWDVDV
jgi:WD40 repeat protein